MNSLIKPIIQGCVPVAVLSVLVTGCQDASAPSPLASTLPVSTSTSYEWQDEPTPTIAVAMPTATPSQEDSKQHEAQVAGASSATTQEVDVPQSIVNPKTTPKPNVKAENAYQQEKPTLMGVKIGSAKGDVVALFGKASKQFAMEEDGIEVYDYGDFSFGFTSKGTVEFVDVHSGDIDPGLHGLRIGQQVQDALSILGKPDAKTAYMLSYKSQGTVLRLDLDPKDSTIQSIKLFSGQ
ncbi:hypothetical protein ABE504_09150 [Paenibacillus oryzisoli]|uniref:hypothetical protein n=1 Tax=Paenibacillus oryzisoli TaxID=1850517 RepID=UPI003D2D99AA